jgi:hypothetical protein
MPRLPRDPSGRGSTVTLYLSPAEQDRLRAAAAERKVSMSALVGALIRRLKVTGRAEP